MAAGCGHVYRLRIDHVDFERDSHGWTIVGFIGTCCADYGINSKPIPGGLHHEYRRRKEAA
jgi:hypothetical protein